MSTKAQNLTAWIAVTLTALAMYGDIKSDMATVMQAVKPIVSMQDSMHSHQLQFYALGIAHSSLEQRVTALEKHEMSRPSSTFVARHSTSAVDF